MITLSVFVRTIQRPRRNGRRATTQSTTNYHKGNRVHTLTMVPAANSETLEMDGSKLSLHLKGSLKITKI